ncbi:MAG: hypothetical protein JWM58_957 [Rhizobium sp.]|nr:hypothetical protein [Rhizobium sp.]
MSLSKPTMSAIRFGYGIRPGEETADGPDALMAQLEKAASAKLRFPAEGIEGRYATMLEFNDRVRDARVKDKEQRRKNLRPIRKDIFKVFGTDQHLRVAQSAFSPYGFHERLATFWVDHFSVSARKQRMMNLLAPLYEAEALRPNMAGPFEKLLSAAIRHPAMLTYLDQIKSSGPNSRRGKRAGKGLNENLGRELLELHTLGVDGGYTQEDVRNAALVLTGLSIEKDSGESDFKPQLAEPGPLTFMGKSYGSKKRSVDDVNAMLADLVVMPQTGKYICRKLAIHFVSDKPPQPLIDAMVAAWTSSGGNLMDVYAAMLKHPAAWDNPGEKARQPYDYVVAGLRALDVPEKAFAMPDRHDDEDDDDEAAPANPAPAMSAMAKKSDPKMAATEMTEEEREDMVEEKKAKKGNKLHPPLNRITVGAMKKLGQPVWEPNSPAGFDEGFDAWISSSQITGRIEWAQRVSGRFAGRLDPDAMLKATLRDAARDDTITVVRQAPNRTAGMSLVLASPEFNRR